MNIFFLKYTKCMLNASNNRFGHISKSKILKNRPFYNLVGAKITKKGLKSFQHRFWRVPHSRNMKKYMAFNSV